MSDGTVELRGRECVRWGHWGRDPRVSVRIQRSLSGVRVKARTIGHAPAVSRVSVKHLQQQVIQQDNVLPLHTGKVLHAFVTADQRGGLWVTQTIWLKDLTWDGTTTTTCKIYLFRWWFSSQTGLTGTRGLQYLRCRICESSMSRWARRADCCCMDKPVREMAHTSASVTASSSRSNFVLLSSSFSHSKDVMSEEHTHISPQGKWKVCDFYKLSIESCIQPYIQKSRKGKAPHYEIKLKIRIWEQVRPSVTS